MHPHHPGHPLQGRLGMVDSELPPPGPPVMRSFKDFLLNMEDSVDETEAVKRYNQYKLDFRRQQLQDFFITHKEHEFRMKYHPEDMVSRRAESQAALKSRMGVFLFLLENGWLDNMSLDMEHAPKIIKLLDAGRGAGGWTTTLTSVVLSSAPQGRKRKRSSGSLCRRYPGFLRVALSDPQPERRFFRRCWVTFDRSVNIKEICWNLQNIRLKDCELAPVVNRDLSRRVRSVNGLTHHKPVVRNDIKLSARLVHALDQKGSLWGEEVRTPYHTPYHTLTSNPVLKNITDYLIEEVSAEEEELTGVTGGNEAGDGKDPSDVTVETDETLLKVLDRLLVYLRLVHSVDYYNLCEYPAEDEMPHRCGLIHVRGPAPLGNITTAEVGEHQKMCEERLAVLLTSSESLSDEEAARLGKKDPDHEVEKFLVANTQELGKDKWLCPLSGKKFKAPEFVRKHILNKHGDKVTAVRQEVEFFNNFLLDAKRPALPENKPPPPPVQAPPPGLQVFPGQTPQQHSLLGYPPGVRPPMQGAGPPYPPNQFGGGRGNYDNFRGHGSGFPGKQRNNSRGVRGDPRSIIEYRDLDAPEDLDFF
uniref:Serrate RNA effector molecule homolog n=1 Tax=Gadus morhua TaxID=8049 RepID=A0A8C4ZR41_GADMO